MDFCDNGEMERSKLASYLLLAVCLCFIGTPNLLSAEVDPSSVFKEGDLLFSKRFESPDTSYIDYAEAYGANRLVWHYAGEINASTAACTKNDLASGNVISHFKPLDPGSHCSLPAAVLKAEPSDIHCVDLDGNRVSAHWEDSLTDRNRGDVLKDRYVAVQEIMARQLIQKGCRVLHQDAVAQNIETLKWGGCFSDEGDQKFRQYLKRRFSPAQLQEHGIHNIDTFNYRQHLIAQGAKQIPLDKYGKRSFTSWLLNPSLKPHSLIREYRNFSAEETVKYLLAVKQAASLEAKAPIKLSGNVYVPDHDLEVYQGIDFVLSEIGVNNRTQYGFLALAAFKERTNKQYVTTLPSSDLKLNRGIFSLAYATGLHMILPYDVYISVTSRYTAAPDDFADLTQFIRENENLITGYSGLETYGQENLSRVTSVSQVKGRTEITHSASSEMKTIPVGSKVRINGKEYLTTSDTSVGILYFPLAVMGDFEDAVAQRYPVESIELPDQTGKLFQIPLRPGGSPVLKVEKVLQRRYRVAFTRSANTRILPGAKVVIGTKTYTALSLRNWGDLEIDPFENGIPRLGESVLSVSNPDNSEPISLLLPNENAPRVKSVDFGVTKPGFTTVNLDSGPLEIPVGTVVKFSQTGAELTTANYSSGVRNLYFPGRIQHSIFPGQAVLSIKDPSGSLLSYARPLVSPTGVWVRSGLSNVIVSVRRNKGGHTLLHVVNGNDSPMPVDIAMRGRGNFGFIPRSCVIRNATGDTSLRGSLPEDRGDDIYRLSVGVVKTWAIVTCRD